MTKARAKFSEGLIQTACWTKWCQQAQLVVPNFTPLQWFEADLWRLSKARMTVEYEIKISRSDFRSDGKKASTSRYRNYRDGLAGEVSQKHQRLALGDERGPNRFYFMAPQGIIPREEVPEFAGLIELEGDPLWPKFKYVKTAPKLHRRKFDDDLQKVMRSFYFRYWQVRNKLPAKADITEDRIEQLLETDVRGNQRIRALEQLVVAQTRKIAQLECDNIVKVEGNL